MATTRLEKARRAFVYTTDIALAVLAVGIVVRLVYSVQELSLAWPRAVGAGVCDVVVCLFFARLCRAAMRGEPRPTRDLAFAGVLAAVALVLAPQGEAGVAALVWTGMVALHVSTLAMVCWGAAATAGVGGYVVAVIDGATWVNVPWVGVQVVGFCALMRVWLFLWRVLKEAHQAQDARAMLAVSEERVRFARDLHDLLGHSLSVITVKSELAAKLLDSRPDRAADEIAAVRSLAKDALREVRAAVQGYRALDLGNELESVRAVLDAAGVRCDFTGDGAGLPEESRTLLAWVIREGATNILKHSTASHCTVTIDGGVLEMRNDGVHHAQGDGGSGLAGLAERIGSAGGDLSVSHDAGTFTLRAEVPL